MGAGSWGPELLSHVRAERLLLLLLAEGVLSTRAELLLPTVLLLTAPLLPELPRVGLLPPAAAAAHRAELAGGGARRRAELAAAPLRARAELGRMAELLLQAELLGGRLAPLGPRGPEVAGGDLDAQSEGLEVLLRQGAAPGATAAGRSRETTQPGRGGRVRMGKQPGRSINAISE